MKSFEIPPLFQSSIIGKIKENRREKDKLKKDFSPTLISYGNLNVYLARHFGFCYGVENAVEIAYKALEENPGKKIFLLSEIIHNPEVNNDLESRGVRFLMDTKGNYLIDLKELNSDDIIIVPAFGTTIEIENRLGELGLNPYQYNTTCPFVEKVWNKAAKIGTEGYTIIIHGKPNHEETKATFSHSIQTSPTIIIKDISEAELLLDYITKKSDENLFYEAFAGRFSEGFDVKKDLIKIGVVNQTTMNADETQEISEFLKRGMMEYYSLDELNLEDHFANMRDTLCYATNDNQRATKALLEIPADYSIIVGGYNSSNTTHLVELAEKKLPTYFIRSEMNLKEDNSLAHYDIHQKKELISEHFFDEVKPSTILLTCGASCPDSIMENVLLKLFEKYNSNLNNTILKNTISSLF